MTTRLPQSQQGSGKTAFWLLSQKTKLTPLLYYTTVILLPTQAGKHFWPEFSTVYGIRVDYLSPTLYLTDLLLMLLFLSFFADRKHRRLFAGLLSRSGIALLLFLFLGATLLFSQSVLLGLYGYLKAWEMFCFALITVILVRNGLVHLRYVLVCLAAGVFAESVLAITQFYLQRSVGGPLYFLGERSFTTLTPGIATTSLSGKLHLRPYATFPHPNVLAGYLLLSLTTLLWLRTNAQAFTRMLYAAVVVSGTVAIVLTMSRLSLILWAITLMLFFLHRFPARKVIIGIGAITLVAAALLFLPHRFFEISPVQESVMLRVDLLAATISMLQNHWVFGVGLKQYLTILPRFFTETQSLFYLQPVHNIFLLWIAETGILGLSIFLFLGRAVGKILKRTLSPLPAILIAQIVIIGMADHYFLTLQQGNLLLALVLGLIFSGALLGAEKIKNLVTEVPLRRRREKNIRNLQIP